MVQRELIRGWARRHPQDELVLVVPSAHRAAIEAAGTVPEGIDVVGARTKPHGLAVMTEYPRIARRVGADVVMTHNFVALGRPSVVFLHDVLFQDHPEWFTRSERLYLRPVTALLPRASAVLTSSAHEARRIRTRNPRVADVQAVGIAPDPSLSGLERRRPQALPSDVDSFLLTVGRLNVRKNLASTITASVRSGEVSARRPLVVVGERDGRAPELDDAARAAIEEGSVLLLGHVPDDELAWLYAHAAVFVFLSLDEGYGLPPVEALAFGTPVVASDIGVFRETVGAHAVLVPPMDTQAAALAIAELVRGGRPDPVAPLDWDGVVDAVRDATHATVLARGRVR